MFRSVVGSLRRPSRGSVPARFVQVNQLSCPTTALSAHARCFYDDAAASGPNALYLESIYAQWKLDSSKLDPKWDKYFKSIEAGAAATPPVSADAARQTALTGKLSISSAAARPAVKESPAAKNNTTRVTTDDNPFAIDPVGLKYLIRAYQVRGHEAAKLDPLGLDLWRGPNGSKIP